MKSTQFQRVQGVGMGFLAGYVDTLGFIALFGLFTAHVTGNFVLIAVAAADPAQTPSLLKLLAFPAFILGVAAARLLVANCERRGASAVKPSYALQLVLLVGFMVCGMLAEPVGRNVGALAMAAGLLGAAAMGAHSAASKLLLTHLAPTSMMTGNVTQLVIDATDWLRGAADGATKARCGKFFWPVVAFALGCAAAAFAFLAFGFVVLIVPVAILCLHLLLAEPEAA
ncbi:YoaK family protein [uncultured Massilia sp.]|uniref:YoaK family protein n=1 Tax=uncultured Massilia sp. TaxID=169973 RepID=UPI002587B100|nr:YoaK family protein [uncultured Massilia sp.]